MIATLKKIVVKILEHYAKKLLRKHKPYIIAITGSVGKTSTKLAVAHVLGGTRRVLAYEGNYNTEFGLPLSLFNLETPEKLTSIKQWREIFKQMRQMIRAEYPYSVVVLEMGADRPGDIKRFTRYITPNLGIITAVAKVHLEQFKTIEAVLEEKWHLAEASKCILINGQDQLLRAKAESIPNVEVGKYGIGEGDYSFNITSLEGIKGFKGVLKLRDETTVSVTLPVVAKQSLYSLVAAAAAAKIMSIGTPGVIERLEQWRQPSGRMSVLAGKSGSIILDDTYNSSPYAAVAALDTLYQFNGRKIAILGSMNELGDYEVKGHRLVGSECGELDWLVTIGAAANLYLVPAAIEAGLPSSRIHECNTPYEAGDFVAGLLRKDDIVLAKGSQNGVFAEEAVKALLEDPKDKTRLVRQSPGWLSKKEEYFE